MSPATIPWILALGTLATVGGIYYYSRGEEEEETEDAPSTGDDEVPPDEEPPPSPPDPGPGGIKGDDGGLPTEPAGGWESFLTPLTASDALQSVREEGIVSTGDQAVLQALRVVFPIPEWGPPLSEWQKDARDFMWDQLRGLASWEVLVGQGAPLLAPYAFWLRRRVEVAACRNAYQDVTDIAQCAASNIFPDETWPPPADAEQWQTTVWQQLLQQVTAG